MNSIIRSNQSMLRLVYDLLNQYHSMAWTKLRVQALTIPMQIEMDCYNDVLREAMFTPGNDYVKPLNELLGRSLLQMSAESERMRGRNALFATIENGEASYYLTYYGDGERNPRPAAHLHPHRQTQHVASIIQSRHRNREPFLHTAVYIELAASDPELLNQLRTAAPNCSKLNVDRLLLRQQGLLCVMPSGWNAFGSQFERVLPASSVANLFPFAYSGKTDPRGFYLGHDKFGSIIVDFDRRAEDKTNANILILGNSGQGKSYLMKLVLCDILECGKSVISLDPLTPLLKHTRKRRNPATIY